MMKCPCGSGAEYDQCCGRFHRGSQAAATAEELMRSRFSAYVMHELDYLYETTHPDERTRDLRQSIESWSRQVQFVKLEVLKTVRGLSGDKTGKVEFIAFYTMGGVMHQHHELSTFKKLKDRWFYMSGEVDNL